MSPRARQVLVLSATVSALLVLAFLYRFNALGSALGGFDNDHFHYYVRAKQVAHGERPLRDFYDHGLQGAWPSLSYELPALAQRIGGETLLTEAVFTIGAIAVSLGVTFLVAARLTGVVPALVVSLITLFLGTRLYGFSKVLVLAVAAALLLAYARLPGRAKAAMLGVWSVVAFLFRHDFVLYVGTAAIVVIVASESMRQWRRACSRLGVYAGVMMLLLAGPLYSIQHNIGLAPYVRANLEISERETQRTTLQWPEFVSTGSGLSEFVGNEDNAAAWLYYLFWTIPILVLFTLPRLRAVDGFEPRQIRALLLSLVALALMVNGFFLRSNLPARFGDLGAPLAILAAWLISARPSHAAVRALAMAAAVGGVAVTMLATNAVGSVFQELDTTGLRDSAAKIRGRFQTTVEDLRALPPPADGDPIAGALNVSDYLRACTKPDDSALVVSSTPEVAAMANRAFAAGQPTFRPGFYATVADQRRMLDRLRRQSVPVVITEAEDTYVESLAPEFPLIHEYLMASYMTAGELLGADGKPMRVLIARERVAPLRTYSTTGLPCFR